MALVFGGEHLTYRRLNEEANRLAHYLRREGVGPDVPVAVLTERSVEMVVGLLGVLKAGGAYVPLDPASPQERLSFMLEDAGIRHRTGFAQCQIQHYCSLDVLCRRLFRIVHRRLMQQR